MNKIFVLATLFVLMSVSAFAGVAVTPATAYTNNDLSCFLVGATPSNPIYEWSRGSELPSYFSAVLPNSATSHFETWTCVMKSVNPTIGPINYGSASVPILNTPPTVNADGPYSAVEGNAVNFIGTASDIDNDAIVSWNWDFGNGAASNLQNPSYAYSQNGTYNVVLTASDGYNNNAATTQAVIADTNPFANFSISLNPVDVNIDVNFTDLSTAYDVPLTYSWNFGDSNGTSNVQNPVYAYSTSGNFSVTLTVTDNDGSIDSAIYNITVNALPLPGANLTPSIINIGNSSLSIYEGENVTFNITAEDPEGSNLTVNWSVDGAAVFDEIILNGSVSNYSRIFPTAGIYSVMVVITDNQSLNDSYSWNVNVSVIPPVIPGIVTVLVNEFEQSPLVGNEWVELFNPNAFPVNISNWEIWEGLSTPGVLHTVPDNTTLAANDYYVVNVTNLNNAGEFVLLYDSYSRLVDNTSTLAEGTASDNCWARVPNGVDTNNSADWTFQNCTQGAANSLVILNLPPAIVSSSPATPLVIDLVTGSVNVDFNVTVSDPEGMNMTVNFTLVPIYTWTTSDIINNSIVRNTYPFTTTGNYTFEAYVYDNISQSAYTNWTVEAVNTSLGDITPPTVIIVSPQNGVYNYTELLVNISTYDDVGIDKIWYEWNGTNITYTEPVLVNFTDNMTHYIYAYANDTSGLMGPTSTYLTIVTINTTYYYITPLVISNVAASNITNESAIITWTTNELANSSINYGIVVNDANYVYNHSFVLSNLTNATQYNYNVTSCDVDNNCTVSAMYSFITVQNPFVDLIYPSITITSPESKTYIVSDIMLNITAADETALNNMWYEFNGTNIAYNDSTVLNFADGAYTLNAYANDTSGNINSTSVVFAVNTTGSMAGNVNDQNSNPLSAVVTILNTAHNGITSGGAYSIFDIPNGIHSAEANATGYLSQKKTGIMIAANQTTNVNFVLTQTGTLDGTVYDFWTYPATITGANVTVYSGSTEISSILTGGAGDYSFDLAPGYYAITAVYSTLTQTITNNQVLAGSTTTVNFALG